MNRDIYDADVDEAVNGALGVLRVLRVYKN